MPAIKNSKALDIASATTPTNENGKVASLPRRRCNLELQSREHLEPDEGAWLMKAAPATRTVVAISPAKS